MTGKNESTGGCNNVLCHHPVSTEQCRSEDSCQIAERHFFVLLEKYDLCCRLATADLRQKYKKLKNVFKIRKKEWFFK